MIYKKDKTEWKQRVFLFLFPLCLIFMAICYVDVYGSSIDWLSQHIVFPDYFRKIFLETKQLFPEFSMNLGAGQNFAQFTYYGLLRPDVLISFLFPKIDISTIFIASNIAYVLLSIQLFYTWMKQKMKSSWSLIFICCLFMFCGPLIFHSHRHIMFISYFPGLLLCLIGTDQYIKNKKVICLLIGIFLMIITSYFFSVSGLVVTGLYAIYARMKTYPDESWKLFFIFLIHYIGWLFLGVMLTGFYLVPSAFALFLQVRPSIEKPDIISLLIPNSGFSSLFYDSYSIGLPAISMVSLIYGIIKKNKETRILSFFLLIIFCVPLFQYILSGLQYVRAKTLIPFLPLVCMIIGNMVDDWQFEKRSFPWWIFIVCFISTIIDFFTESMKVRDLIKLVFFIDLFLLFSLLIIFRKKFKKKLLFIYLLIPMSTFLAINKNEVFVTKKAFNKVQNETKTLLIKDTINNDLGVYRFDDASTSNAANRVEDLRQLKTTQYSSNSNIDYNNFYYNVMKQPMLNRNHVIMASVENPYFNSFMGVKYLYNQGNDKNIHYGYKKILEKQDGFVQKNSNVLPIAYISYDLMSMKQFMSMSYPYSVEAIYMNTVVEKNLTEKNINTSIQKVYPKFELYHKDKNLNIKKSDKGMRIQSKGNSKLVLKMKEPLSKDELLIVVCNIENIKNGYNLDTTVKINGIANKKAAESAIYGSSKADFEYVIGNNNGLKDLTFNFSKGTYTLENFSFYKADATLLKKRKEEVSPFYVQNKANTLLSGKVEALRDGYFVTSIPYQKGFDVYIDKEKVAVEKVNTAFLGTAIKKGTHVIDIIYTQPGKKLGMFISGIAVFFIFLIWIFPKIKFILKK